MLNLGLLTVTGTTLLDALAMNRYSRIDTGSSYFDSFRDWW